VRQVDGIGSSTYAGDLTGQLAEAKSSAERCCQRRLTTAATLLAFSPLGSMVAVGELGHWILGAVEYKL
jgi:hypothetical protein